MTSRSPLPHFKTLLASGVIRYRMLVARRA
jgi:hypothetical protein